MLPGEAWSQALALLAAAKTEQVRHVTWLKLHKALNAMNAGAAVAACEASRQAVLVQRSTV